MLTGTYFQYPVPVWRLSLNSLSLSLSLLDSSAELIPTPAKRRRSGLSKRTTYAEKPEGEEEEDEEEADEEDDFHPSEGSENEMETEMLDYM